MPAQTKENKQSLAAKLAAIGKEIGAVDKSGKNSQQNYAYIEYGVVAGRIRELFDKYHVIIVPNVESIDCDEITAKYGSKGYHYVLHMTFDIINGDDPEDREVASWLGEASDYGDKGINKAETAGTKYFLMRLFNVSEKGDEDADKTTPEEIKDSKPVKKYTVRDVGIAKTQLENAHDLNELKVRFALLGAVKADPEVIAVKDAMKKKLTEVEQEDESE